VSQPESYVRLASRNCLFSGAPAPDRIPLRYCAFGHEMLAWLGMVVLDCTLLVRSKGLDVLSMYGMRRTFQAGRHPAAGCTEPV